MAYILNKLSNANLGWLYYKYYFQNQEQIGRNEDTRDKDILANRNETILKRTFQKDDIFDLTGNKDNPFMRKFSLATVYPGLLIGSGYTHEAVFDEKDKNEAFKIGFFFDHITGMPYIPGSSVKGTIRSVFPNHKKEKYPKEKSDSIMDYLKDGENGDKIIQERFKEYLKKCKISGVEYSGELFVELLGNIIFEGIEPCAYENGNFKYQQITLCKRDIFHDAYLLEGGREKLFLGTDYITRHEDPLKNPNPVKFLKILPGVKIQFQFRLNDDLIMKQKKEDLLKKILLDFGVGAKTNVGYGQFTAG
jgi:CRISPR-associated protein Cmr6